MARVPYSEREIDAAWDRVAKKLRDAISDGREEAAGLRGAADALDKSVLELGRIASKGQWWKLRGIGVSDEDINLISEIEPADRDEWLAEEVFRSRR